MFKRIYSEAGRIELKTKTVIVEQRIQGNWLFDADFDTQEQANDYIQHVLRLSPKGTYRVK